MTDGQTSHYKINLPQDGDSMADVANGFNNAWVIISGAPKPAGVVAGPANPTTGYTVGKVIYNQAWKSCFILLAIDTNWGYIWRPIHAKWGPWVAMTTAILTDTTNYAMANEGPVCYRISNTGMFELAGGIKRTTGAPAVIPNGTNALLQPLPAGCRPDKIWQWTATMHKSGMGSNLGNYYCKVWVNNSTGAWNHNTFNNATGTADADTILYNNKIRFQIADRTDL